MAATTELVQIAAYVRPELKARLEAERKHSNERVSMSQYLEKIIERHLDMGKGGKKK